MHMGNIFAFIAPYSQVSQQWPPTPTFDPKRDIPDLTGKVIIVTGASAGIGYETTKELLRKNAKVYLACRDIRKGERAVGALKAELTKEALETQDCCHQALGEGVVLQLDLSDLVSVKRAATEILNKEERIDILINNAGKEKARVINLSSSIHTIAPHKLGFDWKVLKGGNERDRAISQLGFLTNWRLYGVSKMGNVLMSNFMTRYYGDKITSCSLHPGHINTRLFRHVPCTEYVLLSLGILHPVYLGAYTTLFAATVVPADDINGKFFQPWARFGRTDPRASNIDLQDQLKEWLEKQVEEFEMSDQGPSAVND
ncbi:hypothetical protein Clacol_008634 [Clathrus columnatus]|uniref:NAD(P)-binding protein n=1 Tax=Clathrus columnatus TaxID=1419009 RepID=A0AAV5AJ34_9AGAM|nr:hypothetical protein Clacol_008634 [Clathrus columnatus]